MAQVILAILAGSAHAPMGQAGVAVTYTDIVKQIAGFDKDRSLKAMMAVGLTPVRLRGFVSFKPLTYYGMLCPLRQSLRNNFK